MTREARILHAAASLFAKRGYSSVGVDEIGAAAGVSGPAIYRHFSSKDEILGTLFEQGMDAVSQATAHQLEEPRAALRHMACQHAQHILDNPTLSAVWMNETRSLSTEGLRRYRRRAATYLDGWEQPLRAVHPDAAPDDIRAVAHAMVGALNSVGSWPPALRKSCRVSLLADVVVLAADALTPLAP